MSESAFETALAGRIAEMTDACTRCGKCVAACPSVEPAGLGAADPVETITGIIDILRLGDGSEEARHWANSCVMSGACIKACDYGVNPRFLLAMARVAMIKSAKDATERRSEGIAAFRKHQRTVTTLSRLQATPEQLARLGQQAPGSARAARTVDDREPDFIFYTGCNVLKNPHIPLLALDIMDAIGISYRVLGGPSHCCGSVHLHSADTETMGRVASYAMEDMARSKSKQVITWCPSCFVHFTEETLPTVEKQTGTTPFDMTPFMRFLTDRLEDIKPRLSTPVPMRVALHKHPGVAGAMEAAEALLRAIPGIEIVDLAQPALGLQSVMVSALPKYKRELQQRELDAAQAASIDALVTVYHSDHRELCAHERDWPFRVLNILEILGASMGLSEEDNYKRLKLMQDADAIVADCGDLVARHKLNVEEARGIVAKAMLADQPLPLRGSRPS
ncbi:MAG TPA: (Fe-S)-binding protein [Stellaceae bacterium]|nr:(Fe-S)-binding protein [Stellaceae bacterium]